MGARQRMMDVRQAILTRLTGSQTRTGGGVALTFDDGPMPGATDLVLDALADLNVHATFFCVGRNAERSPALLRRIATEGHAVGSHSLTHPLPWTLSPSELLREYETGREAVQQALGMPVSLFRPPNGFQSPGTIGHLRHNRATLWSVDPQDWRPGVRREHVERVAAASRDGDIVLLHDWVEQPHGPEALDRSATIEALPGIVAAVRDRGSSFVRLTAEQGPPLARRGARSGLVRPTRRGGT